jgi:hypothetical protein
MPYRVGWGVWKCSWNCGFSSNDSDEVIKHENEKHNAVQLIAKKEDKR